MTRRAAFVSASAPRLKRTALLMGQDWHLAQDLTQTTFAKMYASWSRIWRAENLAAYSRRVLVNTLVEKRKRRSHSELVPAEPPEPPGRGPDATTDLHVTLLRAPATLPVHDQAIVVLRQWEDQSVDNIAEIMGVSVSVVNMQNARALQRLRALPGEDFVLG
jgi:RNA polymerase sigma-70 factor (sigma-E family)